MTESGGARLVVERLSAGPLDHLTLRAERGLDVVLGQDPLSLGVLADVLIGSAERRSGTVTVLGRDPRRSPDLRRRIAALRSTEELVPAKTVALALTAQLRLQGTTQPADEVLAGAGLRAWAARDPRQLSALERRSVAAAGALALEAPVLAVLFEPLAYLPALAPERVLERCATWLARDVLIVCLTSSARSAHALGGARWLLQRGRIVPVTHAADLTRAPAAAGALLVRSAQARELAAALSGEPAVSGVGWDAARAPAEIRVHGADLAALSTAICRVARDRALDIRAIYPEQNGKLT